MAICRFSLAGPPSKVVVWKVKLMLNFFAIFLVKSLFLRFCSGNSGANTVRLAVPPISSSGGSGSPVQRSGTDCEQAGQDEADPGSNAMVEHDCSFATWAIWICGSRAVRQPLIAPIMTPLLK